jgi:hypothetical protein
MAPRKRSLIMAVLIGFVVFAPRHTYSFPPYRLTDADTAAPWTVEGRLGLFRIERDRRHRAYSSPLLGVNLGLPRDVELISEFEYRPDEGRVADAAIGFKWIPLMRRLSVGVETLALLPVSHKHHGAGVESSLLTTLRLDPMRVHVNAGGFYDARPATSEHGWRGGVLLEGQWRSFRPGIEVFAKQVEAQPVHVLVGPGVIFDVGPFDVRVGVHVGLTRDAANVTPSLWVTNKVPIP